MGNITSADTYDKDTAKFEYLRKMGKNRVLSFNTITSLGTTCEVKATNDEGTDFTIEDGLITAATDLLVKINADLKVVVTGSPNFNLTVYPE